MCLQGGSCTCSLFSTPWQASFTHRISREHSLMHMMSGHKAADSIPEYSSTDQAALDMAEATFQDQHQVPVYDLSISPQKVRLHSLSCTHALAKSKAQPSDKSSHTAHTPPPVPVAI